VDSLPERQSTTPLSRTTTFTTFRERSFQLGSLVSLHKRATCQ
jgi:hypothetical protein